ncbi:MULTISPECIES: hypothetical protein [unclassified Pseudonocardia]|uniref:hypothetical protein n=1 Tax=unclassified Pseudonocardia TaxID=2619320 RepID=UPI00095BB168|nr:MULTISPECIES: hypothetical protein [unclassified Pseudonocardia]MBN9099515.1 hypothetical protein [Pseudonocardia sp.]OJY53400.1 MAG: hypothetical protein BGP03_00805 [Pseudonocardia sp. 73-21]
MRERASESSAPTTRARAGWLRGFSGLLAGGLAALAVALYVAWFVADRTGSVGPGASTLVWDSVAAVAAVAAQVYADRRAGARGAAAAVGVVAVTAAVLAAQWLF